MFTKDIQHEIEQWFYLEAELLDDLKFDDWFELLHEDIVYKMPLRINEQDFDKHNFTEETLLFNDDIETIQLRIDRLKTDLAWAEIPPSRTRRNVMNVRVKTISKDEVVVKSNLLLYRSRTTDIGADLISGERTDILKRVKGEWKLFNRQFIADQTTISTRNLAVFV